MAQGEETSCVRASLASHTVNTLSSVAASLIPVQATDPDTVVVCSFGSRSVKRWFPQRGVRILLDVSFIQTKELRRV